MTIHPLAAASAVRTVVDSVRDVIPDGGFASAFSGKASASRSEATSVELTADQHADVVDRLRQLIGQIMDRASIPRDPPVQIELLEDGTLSMDPADPRSAQLADQVSRDPSVLELSRQAALPALPLTLVV